MFRATANGSSARWTMACAMPCATTACRRIRSRSACASTPVRCTRQKRARLCASARAYAVPREQISGPGRGDPTWQRLGATFGSDTNAETSPTHTSTSSICPNIDAAKLEESFKLLSGMVREPVLSDANVAPRCRSCSPKCASAAGRAERSAEARAKRCSPASGSPRARRSARRRRCGRHAARRQRLPPRWYRPENTVIVAVGDVDPMLLAALIETYFGDWQGAGARPRARFRRSRRARRHRCRQAGRRAVVSSSRTCRAA